MKRTRAHQVEYGHKAHVASFWPRMQHDTTMLQCPCRREAQMELQDEAIWLRSHIVRMRLAFRFVIDPRVESILREFIADGRMRPMRPGR